MSISIGKTNLIAVADVSWLRKYNILEFLIEWGIGLAIKLSGFTLD